MKAFTQYRMAIPSIVAVTLVLGVLGVGIIAANRTEEMTNIASASGSGTCVLTFEEVKAERKSGHITTQLTVDSAGRKATAKVVNNTNCSFPASFISYEMYDQTLENQRLYDEVAQLSIAPKSSKTLVVDLPSCMAQVDLFYGQGPHNLSQTNEGKNLAYAFHLNETTGYRTAKGPFCKNIPDTEKPQVNAFCSATVSKATVTWKEAGRGDSGYYVDIDNDNNWSNGYWHKDYWPGTLSATLPEGYTPANGASGALTLTGDATYYVRIYYKATKDHTPTVTFKASKCQPTVCTPDPERDLSGTVDTNGNGTVVNNSTLCSYNVGLASYKKFDSNINNQVLFDSDLTTIGPKATVQLKVDVPSCAAQIDLFYGSLITSFANGDRYGDRLLDAKHVNGDNYCVNETPISATCSSNHSNLDIGEAVTYTANATGGNGAYSYSWSGTDGLTGSSKAVSKSYSTSGSKTATVVITSGTKSVTKQCTVTVKVPTPTLSGSCSASPSSVKTGETVTWTANASGGTGSYTYSWSGAVSGTGKTKTNSFSSAGTKTATVKITSGNQEITKQCSVSVAVQVPTLTGSCSANRSNLEVGESVTFSASASGGNGSYTYSWSGVVSGSGQSKTTSFGTPGTKIATVTITSDGQSITRQCQTHVNDYAALAVSCSATPANVQTDETVTWTTHVSGGTGSYTYSWSGTNGLNGTSRVITKQYSSAGTKTGTVTVTSGNQSVTRNCYVHVEEHIQGLTGSCSASPSVVRRNETVTWTANASGGNGAYSYSWSGTDGLSQNGRVVSRSYGSTGTKYATVTITSGNQTITRQCNVYVEEYNTLDVTCSANPWNPNINETVTWTANASGGNGAYSYSWSGTDNLSGSSRNVYKSYNQAGTKQGTVTVHSDGQSVTRQCTVNVQTATSVPLTAYCTASPSQANINQNVTWSVYASGGNGSYGYSWYGTDGIFGTSQTINKSYNTTGQKTANVVITSNGETITRTCTITVAGGITVFRNPGNDPLASYVYLSQVPYTGIGSGLKVTLFVLMLLAWSGFIGYLVIRKKAMKQGIPLFDDVVGAPKAASQVGSIREKFTAAIPIVSTMPNPEAIKASMYKEASAVSVASPYIAAASTLSPGIEEEVAEALEAEARKHQTIVAVDALKMIAQYSFGNREKALSTLAELIAIHRTNLEADTKWLVLTSEKVSKILYGSFVNMTPNFIEWLAQGSEDKVFSFLRMLEIQGQSIRDFVKQVVVELDGVQRHRREEGEAHEHIVSATAHWSDHELEHAVGALVGAIEEGYKSTFTSVKIALMKITNFSKVAA